MSEARDMLTLAGRDYRAACVLHEEAGGLSCQVGFLLQQTVEKCLKAVLAHHGKELPRIHDLNRLFYAVETLGYKFAKYKSLVMLNDFAVTARYDLSFSSDIDWDNTIIAAGALLDEIKNTIGEGS